MRFLFTGTRAGIRAAVQNGCRDAFPSLRLNHDLSTKALPMPSSTGQQITDVLASYELPRSFDLTTALQDYCNVLPARGPWVQIQEPYNPLPQLRLPCHPEICLKTLSLGSFYDENTFVEHYCSLKWLYELQATFEHDIGQFSVDLVPYRKFQVNDGRSPVHRLEYKYQSFSKILLCPHHNGTLDAYIFLKHPGKPYRVQRHPNQNRIGCVCRIEPGTTFSRCRTFSSCTWVVFGNSNVLSLCFDSLQLGLEVVSRIALRAKVDVFFSPVLIIPPSESQNAMITNNFAVQYMWTALQSRGYQVTDHITAEFVDDVSKRAKHYPEIVERALTLILNAVDDGYIVNFREAFHKLFAPLKEEGCATREVYRGCRYTRKVILTPTRRLFLQPELFSENRVIRKFGEEYAMRVSIRYVLLPCKSLIHALSTWLVSATIAWAG